MGTADPLPASTASVHLGGRGHRVHAFTPALTNACWDMFDGLRIFAPVRFLVLGSRAGVE
eukprot:6308278-Pyramimonas_sp.AAC.1